MREPVNGLTHAAGAVLGAVALIVLVGSAAGADKAQHVLAFAIYGASLILLYSASALYHLLPVGERALTILRRIDHMMIYVLIAGTYTPICLIVLSGAGGMALLAAVWLIAVVGMFFSGLFLHAPRWLSTSLYVAMGWMAIVVVVPLVQALTAEGLLWLCAGGLFYTVGAIVYAIKKPNPCPGTLGFHEIWHLFVLAGSACHFMMMLRCVLPIAMP